MNDFDQKRADQDAIRYNTDGRNYDLKLQDQRLEIVARPTFSMLWMSTMVDIAPVVLFILFLGSLPPWQRWFIALVGTLLINQIVKRFIYRNGDLEPKRWIFDKSTGQLCADAREIARIEDIVAVRAWKKG